MIVKIVEVKDRGIELIEQLLNIIAYGDGIIEIFTRPAVLEPCLAVLAQPRLAERLKKGVLPNPPPPAAASSR